MTTDHSLFLRTLEKQLGQLKYTIKIGMREYVTTDPYDAFMFAQKNKADSLNSKPYSGKEIKLICSFCPA